MSLKLKHSLPLGLIFAFSLGEVPHESPLSAAEPASSLSQQDEPRRLPWYSSPLEFRSAASKVNQANVRPGTPPRMNQRATNAARQSAASQPSGAQNIPSSVANTRRPVVRQVAAPGNPQNAAAAQQYQAQQYQDGGDQSSVIQQQLDAMYREKGLEAPQMRYDALPVQGQEDYEAMQNARPQQAAAGVPQQNAYRPAVAQQAGGQQPEKNPSWVQRIFGRRAKQSESAPQQPQTPATAPQQQGGMNPQWMNQPQNQASQQSQQLQQPTQPQGASAPQEYVPSQQPAQTRPNGGLDYSQLRQSRAPQQPQGLQQPQGQSTRNVMQNPQGLQQTAPEVEEELEPQDSTPRLNSAVPETAVEQNTAPAAPRSKPSPFENLEIHTPEEQPAEQAATGEVPEQPVAELQDTVQQPAAEQPFEDVQGQSADPSQGTVPVAQPGTNPVIRPGNDQPAAQPILGSEDEEQEAKYRILAAFPELDGLKGFCPVVLRNDRELLRAKRQYALSYDGQDYQFSSQAALQKFEQSPEKYVPIARGQDIVQLSQNQTVTGSLDFAAWYRGRLYLFTNLENLEAFVQSPATYEQIALGGAATPRQHALESDEEPEESLELEEESAGSVMEPEEPTEQSAPGNRSPADALRGSGGAPSTPGNDGINVPPPPNSSEDDEVDMPGRVRPTSRLSQTIRKRFAPHTQASR